MGHVRLPHRPDGRPSARPGRRRPEDYADGNPTRSGDNAIRVAQWELGVLQGFRPDYPWQGTKTRQGQQVGNAVPPPMAAALLEEIVSVGGGVAA